jgi:hypothetical protein
MERSDHRRARVGEGEQREAERRFEEGAAIRGLITGVCSTSASLPRANPGVIAAL